MLYLCGDNVGILINTSLTVGDALGFYAALLAFLGTVLLGAIAVMQNTRLQKLEENDYYRTYGCNILLENNNEEKKEDEILLSNDGTYNYKESNTLLRLKIKNYSDAFLKRIIIEFLDFNVVFMSYVTVAKDAEKKVFLCLPACITIKDGIRCNIEFVSCYDSVTYADFQITNYGVSDSLPVATMKYYHFYGDRKRAGY